MQHKNILVFHKLDKSELSKTRMDVKKFLYLSILLFIIFSKYVYSQNVVISEYFNGATPADDWTELLVTADNISLEFYTLSDYRNLDDYPSGNSWGIQFKQHSLWRNIRAGTIIVIHHRGSELIDVNKSDGYIELGAENTDYFVKFGPDGTWDKNALDVNKDTTIIKLESNFGNYVHSLSHMAVVNTTFLSLPTPKLNFPGICPVGESISVVPGSNLNEYDGIVDINRCAVSQGGNFVTKGKPNKKQNSTTDNLKFWQNLRTPLWINTQLNTVVKPDYVELIWSPTSDNYNDAIQGYLILRILQKDLAKALVPSNGTSYKKGDSLGSAYVVDNENASLTTSYKDTFNFDCSEGYVYRIYSYRYNQDDLLGNGIAPSYGRGRTYNLTNFAETTVRKNQPAKPTIIVQNNNPQFCSGDSLLLTASVFGGPYDYEWSLNAIPLPNSNRQKFYARQSGWYKVKITDEKGCSAISDAVQLSELPSPTALLRIAGKIVTKDTTISCCENENYLLNVSGGDSYEWFKDNTKLPDTENQLLINQDGIYYAVARKNGIVCTDTSVRVKLDVININYNFDRDTLFFYLDKYTKFQDQAVRISNSSTDTLRFIDIMIPPGGVFSVFVPPPSEIVLPNRSKDYTVRFEPNRSGIYLDSITFILPCKNSIKKVYLVAQKERMNVEANPSIAVFDTLIACNGDSVEKIIKVYNYENFDIQLEQPKTEEPFTVVTTTFPQTIYSNGSSEIKIKFRTNIPGNYDKFLIIPFSANGINDGIVVQLNGKALSSSYRLEFYGQPLTEIEFPPLTGCDDSTVSAFQIFNTGEVDLEFALLKNIPGIYIDAFPIVIKPKMSKEIPVIFVPQQEGNFNETMYITTSPCSFIDSVKLKGSKQGITYALSKADVDFKQIINCIQPGVITDSINIIVSGKSQVTPYISKITGPKNNYFSHNIKVNTNLTDTNKFYIKLESLAEGNYIDTIKILIKPCDIEKIIPLHAKRVEPHLTTSTDTLNFGRIPIETQDTSSLILKNSGEVPITIFDIKTLNAPFRLLTTFPILLQSDSIAKVFFEYSPQQMKDDILKLDIQLSEPCKLTHNIWLIGKGDIPKYIEALISVPNINSGKLGKELNIPVSVSSKGSRSINEAVISNIKISLGYNPTLIYPVSVDLSDAISKSVRNNLQYIENPPGFLNIDCSIDTLNKIKDGTLFDIKFLALLGNSISTNLNIENISFTSNIPIKSDTTGGVFTLLDNCAIDKRLLSLQGNFDLFFKSENPLNNGSKVVMIAELVSDAQSELSVYDVNGNKLLILMQGVYKAGKYEIDFNTDDFCTGIYLIVLKNGQNIKTLKLTIIK
jgi:hypothetical protein